MSTTRIELGEYAVYYETGNWIAEVTQPSSHPKAKEPTVTTRLGYYMTLQGALKAVAADDIENLGPLGSDVRAIVAAIEDSTDRLLKAATP